MDAVGLGSGVAAFWNTASGLHLAAAVVTSMTLVLALMRWLARAAVGAPGGPRAPLAGLAMALVLLAVSRWIRGHPAVPPDLPVVAAEALALVFLLVVYVRSRSAVS